MNKIYKLVKLRQKKNTKESPRPPRRPPRWHLDPQLCLPLGFLVPVAHPLSPWPHRCPALDLLEFITYFQFLLPFQLSFLQFLSNNIEMPALLLIIRRGQTISKLPLQLFILLSLRMWQWRFRWSLENWFC